MEIHHPKVEKKNFKEYLLEGLMIFLAVTLGFFAENFRENLKNNNEIESDMQSILADLQSDVVYFDSVLVRNDYSCVMADSVVILLHGDRSNTSEIYYAARSVTANFGYFYSNAKTFEQMKSSGALRLIAPRSLLDSIANYYSSMQWLTNQSELMRLKIDAIHNGNSALFDSYIFQDMMHITYGNYQRGVVSINKPAGHPELLPSDFSKINDVSMRYHYLYTTTKFYDKTGTVLEQQAQRLITQIKKEYPLQ